MLIKPAPAGAVAEEAQVDPNFIPVEVISANFHSLMLKMRMQGFAQQISNFGGEGSRAFKNWLRDMAKVAVTLGNESDKMTALAIQTIQGAAAEYAFRILRQNPHLTWDEFKQKNDDQVQRP